MFPNLKDIDSLPLSWTTNNSEELTETVKENNICWISHAYLHEDLDFYNVIENFVQQKDNDLIIRGCDTNIKNFLESKGFNSVKAGYEAVLDTTKNCFSKKSLKELVKRGFKKGEIEILDYSAENKQKLDAFAKISKHSSEPQLKNLFLTEFKPNHLLYVLKNDKEWLGAVSISKNSRIKIHTELILRKDTSPIGTLEAIIYQIYEDAKQKNFRYLSLGEVPFMNKVDFKKNGFYSSLIVLTGKSLKFAYNYEGLRKFKNKFNPIWEPIYICVSKKISIKHIFFLFVKSNFYRLMLYKLFNKLNFLK